MSCEIRPVACILNISAIKRSLFPTDDHRGGDSWLQTCKVSVSPAGDIIAVANERRLVVLTSKWDSSTSLSMFQITYADSIHEYDKVKAVLCLPIVGHSHSSHVGPDWTCIVIGYDSGYVRFYTESCDLLFEEQFHAENITSIKCQSQHSPRPDISPELHNEELYIQYQSNICVVNGQQLFGNLKNFRSQLAIVQAKGSPIDLQPTPLNIKKWGFQDQASISDVTVVGLNMSSTFDHLLNASTCGGFDSKYRNTAPNSTLVLAAGSKPFLGYHYALEGVNQPVLSDVAKAVASKLKSALPGWLTGNKPSHEKDVTVAMQPVDSMVLRFGLCDLRRTGSEVILTPNKKLAAMTDSLGRVLLVDAFKGIVIKVFKGYREAQCAFLQVPDERRSKHRVGNKVAHFLMIYSPKKGTLEIFTVQQGTKIATFSASKYSRLLYITHGLMGFSTTSKSKYICQFSCIFMDNDGQIKEILVPFHYAVAEKNSKRARDIHLYKKLRQFIKCGEFDKDKLQNETCNICSELKTVEIKTQTLDMLLGSREVFPEIILSCLDCFTEHQEEDLEGEIKDSFKTLCQNARSLLDLYVFVNGPDEEEHINKNDKSIENNTALILEDKELENLQKLLDLATSSNDHDLKTPHVRFSDKVSFTVAEFMASFDLTKSEAILLRTNLEEDTLFRTSEVLFKKYISGENRNFDKFRTTVLSSGVPVKNLFDLIIHYWVNRALDINLNLEKDMNNFSDTISMLVKIASKEITANPDIDSVSSFWENIRENLGNSSRPFPALMAAMLCKNVAQKYELENSEENIEVLTQENVQWSLLIGKLEDVSTLNIILSSRPKLQDSVMPKLPRNKADVSLKYILRNGRGSVSELTAQWLTSCGVEPQNIVVNEIIYRNALKESLRSSNSQKQTKNHPEVVENLEEIQISEGMHLETIERVKSEPIFKYLNMLKQQFPYSLESSTLLANMCWEYALSWRKEVTRLEYLEAALKCLNCITDNCIKQGLFHLVWNTHLKIVAESSCKLINKVGKLPKERLCQQDTGLTDKQITGFISISTEFLDSFLDVAQLSCDSPKSALKFEPIWENGAGGPIPLVELALQKKDVDYNLLHLHYQLSMVLLMITKFAIKHSKPVNNLFEASLAALFFTDLQKKVDMNWNKSDIKTNTSRMHFLHKIITASLETVTLNEDGQIYCKEHVDWMDKCLTLARIWNLNIDDLKRFQITQLYISGYDLVAQELIPAVTEPSLLGEELLKVAGKRLSQFLSSSPNLSENIAAVSPALNRYIESLNGEWCSPGDLENIKILATHALHCISEKQEEHYRLAELLLDACNTLEEFNPK